MDTRIPASNAFYDQIDPDTHDSPYDSTTPLFSCSRSRRRRRPRSGSPDPQRRRTHRRDSRRRRRLVGLARSGHAPQLYDSTLPALTPTPRAVDDPGAYEPALPLHILTHIHHLQAGEIALATPAAALRLCLAYSRTCFPPPLCVIRTSKFFICLKKFGF